LFKQEIIKDYARRFLTEILVESGTYTGRTIQASIKQFRYIVSIELDWDLVRKSKRKFARHEHVQIFWGDSRTVLPLILSAVLKPCLFWLDAHYSGGITAKSDVQTPIIQELEAILAEDLMDHVILIDDARLFVGEHDFPTIADIKDLVKERRPNLKVEVKHDVIRIHK